MNATLLERNVRVPELIPQHQLEFDVQDVGHAALVIRIRGEATCDLAAELDEHLRSSLAPSHQFVILDLAGLEFAGRRALQTVAELAWDLRRRGGKLSLAGLQRHRFRGLLRVSLHPSCET